MTHSGQTIAVVHGGTTHTRQLSLQYGKLMTKIFGELGINVMELHLHPNGSWTVNGQTENVESAIKKADKVWNCLVGVDGETGIVEELCERCKVKLVGHTHFHSHLVGDKQNFSYALEQHNIKVPFGKVILKKEYSKDKLKDVFSTVPFPAVVKPLRGSNGWGVNIVTNFAEFERAVEFLISDDKDVLVQKLILGVPISCFVFEHGNLLHTNIKADDTAELTREDLITVRNDALYIHSVMAFSHHASYDFVMQIKNGKKQLYFLEANTHPSLMTDFIKESFGKSVKIQDYVRSKIT